MLLMGLDKTAYADGRDFVLSLTAEEFAALGQDAVDLVDWLDTVLIGMAAWRTGRDPQIGEGEPWLGKPLPVSSGDRWNRMMLAQTSALIERLTLVRNVATARYAASHGETAATMGTARSTAASRRASATSGPAAGDYWVLREYGPEDHPGVEVPEPVRPWSVDWLGYAPVDITPPELRPEEGLAASAEWAEGVAVPLQLGVVELIERMEGALVPYAHGPGWWPRHPEGRTGRRGRNLPAWGENRAGDSAIVTEDEQMLLIVRDDGGGCATPGGMAEASDPTPLHTVIRETREEVGIELTGVEAELVYEGIVPDRRATDHAWAATSVYLFRLPAPVAFTAGSDAAAAGWWPCSSLQVLEEALAEAGLALAAAARPVVEAAIDRVAARR